MTIKLEPIAYIKNNRKKPIDDDWLEVVSEIKLIESLPSSCFDGIEDFSHLEIIFYFDKSKKTVIGSEHPRGNKSLPKVGIFAQRKKDRPNHIGATIVTLLERKGKILKVKYLDAIDGTPVLDIKPVFKEFIPNCDIKQTEWSKDLMKNYWKTKTKPH